MSQALNFISRNRVFSALVVAGVLLLSFSVRMFQAAQPASIGDFILPPLAGWSRQVSEEDGSRKVSYNSHVSGNALFISLTCNPPDAKGPQTLPRMQSEFAASRSEIGALAAKFGAGGTGIGAATYQPTILNGQPAVLVKEKWGGTTRTEVQSLLLVKGGHGYTLMSMLSVPENRPSLPEADNQLSDAWQTLGGAIRP